jgi:hypothetical protein
MLSAGSDACLSLDPEAGTGLLDARRRAEAMRSRNDLCDFIERDSKGRIGKERRLVFSSGKQ